VKVGLEQMELLNFIWMGKCSWYISIRTTQYNESSVPRNNNGETFVPDYVPVLCRVKKYRSAPLSVKKDGRVEKEQILIEFFFCRNVPPIFKVFANSVHLIRIFFLSERSPDI
jgi:hypothetical protein